MCSASRIVPPKLITYGSRETELRHVPLHRRHQGRADAMTDPGDPWDDDEDDASAWFAWDDLGEDDDLAARSERSRPSTWLAAWIDAAHDPNVLRAIIDATEAGARLEARLAFDPAVMNAAQRLAQAEAADAMWLAGDAGARDRLALYVQGVRAAIDGRDQLAHWALRRISSDIDPSTLDVNGLRNYLGRARSGRSDRLIEEAADLFPQPTGGELDQALAEWLDISRRLTGQHRLIRAAILHRAWRWLNLSGLEDPVSPSVIAASIAGGPSLPFAPFAGAVRRLRTFTVQGSEIDRLYAMVKAFHEGATQANLMLEHLAHWRVRASEVAATKAMRAVIDAVAIQPVTSSNAIAKKAGLTPQAVNNAARTLMKDGLIKEATGQSRFRLWQAPL